MVEADGLRTTSGRNCIGLLPALGTGVSRGIELRRLLKYWASTHSEASPSRKTPTFIWLAASPEGATDAVSYVCGTASQCTTMQASYAVQGARCQTVLVARGSRRLLIYRLNDQDTRDRDSFKDRSVGASGAEHGGGFPGRIWPRNCDVSADTDTAAVVFRCYRRAAQPHSHAARMSGSQCWSEWRGAWRRLSRRIWPWNCDVSADTAAVMFHCYRRAAQPHSHAARMSGTRLVFRTPAVGFARILYY
ncbi:uncharacterized protein LOC119454424 isoform X2 [Dermacentor silvarum]|uniref:uncharacterized protein LOC119454424 isoform X2 n=1 Tax=Dermacentor silvarum TaxID=543639 RepID=UPI002101541C|nr:uncharacterized protein LOC119454424 isoform X2 [Dermacentor silvarum]